MIVLEFISNKKRNINEKLKFIILISTYLLLYKVGTLKKDLSHKKIVLMNF